MKRRTSRGILALGALSFGLAMAPAGADAQLFGFGGPPTPPSGGGTAGVVTANAGGLGVMNTQNAAGMGAVANPFLNPYMSPFLNAQPGQTMSPQDAAYFFIMANQMGGGIGSGKLGGPNAVLNPSTKPAAPRGASNTPGATASRYFNRTTTTPAKVSTARYYSRESRYFPNNGR